MATQNIDRTDATAGLLFIAFGLVFGVQSLGLDLGTTMRMGPGYFPLVLSIILLLFGGAIVYSSLRKKGEDIGAVAWRGLVYILPAPVFFGLTVQGLGFVPSVFITTLVAGRATLHLSWFSTLLLALAVTVFSTLVFSYGLGLPFRRFGPWLPLI